MLKKNLPFHRQRGITLLESLVAIVVMALGILGILGVQLRTLADTQNGVRRAQAIRLIEDLSERMKINPNALGNLDSYVSGWKATAAATTNCKTSACNANELALYDIKQWKESVTSTLGNNDTDVADANVFLVSDESTGNRRQLGVMISWRENERKKKDGTNDTDYVAVFAPDNTGTTAGVSCPTDRSCHIQYVQLTSRCEPYLLGGPSDTKVYCPGI